MGFYLGGFFELDVLKFKLIMFELCIENLVFKYFIQVVGQVEFDIGGMFLCFYIDDDVFL